MTEFCYICGFWLTNFLLSAILDYINNIRRLILMKMTQILALALVAVMALSMLVACNNSENTEDDGVIKIGLLAPLTGDVAQYGMAVRNGAMLYIDQVNEAGGINGKKIEVIEYDEKGDETEAVNAYNRLVEDGVTAIIGDVTTAPTIAIAMESVDDNMPIITASATASEVTSFGNNTFRSCFIDPFQGEKMAQYAKEVLGASTAAILYQTGGDYQKGLADAFVEKAGEIGLEIVATEGYAAGDKDFKSQLTNIASKNPDVFFCPNYYEDIGLIVAQAKEMNLSAQMLGGDGWDGVTKYAAAEDIEGAIYCSGYAPGSTDETIKFAEDYKAKYGEDVPNMFAVTAYDAALLMVNAIKTVEEAGGLTEGSDEYKQAIIDAMEKTDIDGVTGHYTFDENNNPVKTAAIIKIVNGETVFDRQF